MSFFSELAEAMKALFKGIGNWFICESVDNELDDIPTELEEMDIDLRISISVKKR